MALLCAALVVPAQLAAQTTAAPPTTTQAPQTKGGAIDQPITAPDKPLYSPFTARYLLDEIKLLRMEFERNRATMIEKQVNREYRIAKDAAGYAQSAVELFFYIIIAVTTLLVFVGWNSMRDINARVREIAETKVESLIKGYSSRLDGLEAELEEKTRRLKSAQSEISQTNEIHSLWLRASQENAPAAKIAVYDEILKLRPDDVEAMTYKADAALQLDQPQWTLSLANRALEMEPENGQALYQRACAHAFLGAVDDAISDLEAAIGVVDSYKDQARIDPAFERLQELEAFQTLTHREEISEPAGA